MDAAAAMTRAHAMDATTQRRVGRALPAARRRPRSAIDCCDDDYKGSHSTVEPPWVLPLSTTGVPKTCPKCAETHKRPRRAGGHGFDDVMPHAGQRSFGNGNTDLWRGLY